MWRVASTPLIDGMFRSMTTTSGASSRTSCTASAPLAASPAIWTPPSSSIRLRSPARNRAWPPTSKILGSSRVGGAAVIECTWPRNTSYELQEGDRDSARERTGVLAGGDPDVDAVAPDRAAGVGGDAVAVARNPHPRAERDHARVDRD